MSEPTAIRASFQYTFEDFAEAQRAHGGNRPWLLWMFYGLTGPYALFFAVVNASPQQTTSSSGSALFDLLRIYVPLIVALVLILVVSLKVARQSSQPWSRGVGRIVSVNAAKWARLTGTTVACTASLGLIVYRISLAAKQPWGESQNSPVLLAVLELVPGVLVAAFILLMGFPIRSFLAVADQPASTVYSGRNGRALHDRRAYVPDALFLGVLCGVS